MRSSLDDEHQGGSPPSCCLLWQLDWGEPAVKILQASRNQTVLVSASRRIRDRAEPILGRHVVVFAQDFDCRKPAGPKHVPQEPRPEPSRPVAEGQSTAAATLGVAISCRTLPKPRAGDRDRIFGFESDAARAFLLCVPHSLRNSRPRPHLQNTSREAAGSVRLCTFA